MSSNDLAPSPLVPPATPPIVAKGDGLILLGIMCVVALAAAIAMWPALSCQAICFDDTQYLVNNRLVRTPSWASCERFLSEVLQPSSVKGYYQPLTMISLMVDYAMAGSLADLGPFHRTSLFIHVLNALLIVFLLYQLFGSPSAAGLCGLLFGVHPMAVECVAWSSERKTLLAGFFCLVSLILYVRYTQRRTNDWLIGAGVAYVCALLSKPTSVPLPLVMLMMDAWPLKRISRETVIEKIPFFGLALVSAAITLVSQSNTAGIGPTGERVLPTVLLTVCHNIVYYLSTMVWPRVLTPHHAFPDPFNLNQPALLAGLIGSLVLIPGAILCGRKWPAIPWGGLIFFTLLLPTLQVVGFTFVIASDKYAYLPALGALMIPAWVIAGIRQASARSNRSVIVGRLALASCLFLACFHTWKTREYLAVWKDSETLHQHMFKHSPKSGMIADLVASDLLFRGKVDEALDLEQKAVVMDPQLPAARHNLGTTLLRKGRMDEAMAQFAEAVRLNPNYAAPRVNMGRIYFSQGKVDQALEELDRAVKSEPEFAEAHFNYAIALGTKGKHNEAVGHFVLAIANRPFFPEAHFNLGILLAQLGNMPKAIDNFREAVRQSPNYLAAHNALARALDRAGMKDEALAEYREIVRLNPEDQEARRAVEVLFIRQRGINPADAPLPPIFDPLRFLPPVTSQSTSAPAK